jgi:hypothetical protein
VTIEFDTWHPITTCFPFGILKKSHLIKRRALEGVKLNDNKLKIRNMKLSQTQTLSFPQTKHIYRRHGGAFQFLKCR